MGKRILVIDDEKDLVDALCELLADHGYEAEGALSGPEGIEKAKKNDPHLILLDISMPDMDGFQCLKEIRKFDTENRYPVIVVSAKSGSDHIFEAQTLAAKDYFIKPFDEEDLLRKIDRNVRRF